jgi:hypothetical protein
MTPSLVLYNCSILNAHTNDTNGYYLITFYLGPVHSVKKSAKSKNRVYSVGGGGWHNTVIC